MTLRLEAGRSNPDGLYVPVDYHTVGGLTGAVGRPFRVVSVWEPSSIFGRPM